MIEYGIYILVGISAAIVNTLAGGASIFTLSAMIFFNIPIGIANGTNRLGLLVQQGSGAYSFFRKGLFSWKNEYKLVLIILAGALVGSFIVVDIPEIILKNIIGFMMLALFGLMLFKKKLKFKKPKHLKKRSKIFYVLFFLIGIYGGFIQVGVGLIILTLIPLFCNYSLLKTTALKLIIISTYTFPVLMVFIYNNQIAWKPGIALALGQWLGAKIVSKYMVKSKNIEKYINYLILIMLLVGALKMLFW